MTGPEPLKSYDSETDWAQVFAKIRKEELEIYRQTRLRVLLVVTIVLAALYIFLSSTPFLYGTVVLFLIWLVFSLKPMKS